MVPRHELRAPDSHPVYAAVSDMRNSATSARQLVKGKQRKRRTHRPKALVVGIRKYAAICGGNRLRDFVETRHVVACRRHPPFKRLAHHLTRQRAFCAPAHSVRDSKYASRFEADDAVLVVLADKTLLAPCCSLYALHVTQPIIQLHLHQRG